MPRQLFASRFSQGLFALVVALPAPAMAQEGTQTAPLAGALPTFLAGTAPANDTASCIKAGYTPTAQTPMRMKVTISTDGGIQGLPELLEPENPDSAIRADYLGMVTATESCAPVDWGSAGDYVLSVSAMGEMSVQPSILVTATPVAPTVQVAPNTGLQAPAANLPTFLAPVSILPSSPETEDLLALDRQAIRDIQARLFVSGYDPNGVDGVLGNGARAALGSWQVSIGAAPNGYLNAQQLQMLTEQSQAQLDLWLQEPSNAAAYSPPKATAKKTSTPRKKRKVRACKRNAIGMLYDCRTVYR